ncbi:RICIN domain-containing protein [Fluviispira multicolorata]|uniref:Ricin B lectin domain-containing protein n=1 Tax=Fluviispira multicolorata TaxID=2654512 RepID=A0A833JEG2_9BACT|nr:hypothetical protein [Fluviispira multicolorata]KAB8029859.1 hypothetical protein GCL57_09990 [Fluviispira multicolorata]
MINALSLFQNYETGRFLDSNYNGNIYTLPQNGVDFQKWNRQYSGIPNRYYLQNKATGHYLDSNYNGDVYTLPFSDSHYQKWAF